MSNGIDALADQKAPGYLMNILESSPDSLYHGQNFTGDLVNSNITNIVNSSDPMIMVSDMFGADIDSASKSGLTDRDAESTFNVSGAVENDND